MIKIRKILILLAFVSFVLITCQNAEKSRYGVFAFDEKLILPGQPEDIYDAISGDISGWWDHSFSEKPVRLFIEAKPGGGFYEWFNEQGEGAKHATVILAERGKILRFVGPLGLSGQAIDLVCTYSFSACPPDSMELLLSVHAAGEMVPATRSFVQSVWQHFLFERFKPYIESGQAKNWDVNS